jgi:hypothetical protein
MCTRASTRRALHAVAELVLAGPQHRASGTIRLRVTANGFATVADPALTVTATELLTPVGPLELLGATCAALAKAFGAEAGPPVGLFKDHAELGPDEPLHVDADEASALFSALRRGDAALRRLARDQTPVLWPDHFDVGIQLDEVNYGVSPGDHYVDEPYAYVGPWTPRTGEFWNAPFGAARPLRALPGDALDHFLAEGRALAAG